MKLPPHLIDLPALLLLLFVNSVSGFIVGGCIGPKSVLERLLSPSEKLELRRMVHTSFDGENSSELLSRVNQFVLQKIGPERWNQILPELVAYQSKGHECSIYAQLLPKQVYKNLLNSVWRASEAGASKNDLKRLVEDYVDRALAAGIIPAAVVPPKASRSAVDFSSGFYRTAVSPVQPVTHSVVRTVTQPAPLFPIFQPVWRNK